MVSHSAEDTQISTWAGPAGKLAAFSKNHWPPAAQSQQDSIAQNLDAEFGQHLERPPRAGPKHCAQMSLAGKRFQRRKLVYGLARD